MAGHKNKVRIIAGIWRGRKLSFPDVEGLRPTHDRYRETLFNWLSPNVVGSRCLDLFAGSGALGFEAASRGADSVVLVDHSSEVVNCLRENQKVLDAENLSIIQASIPFTLPALQNKPFDLVFLDPPYSKGLVASAFQWLTDNKVVAPGSLIFVECELGLVLDLPADWAVLRQKQSKTTAFYLIEFSTE